jgi:CheY-like chemotaxis protein
MPLSRKTILVIEDDVDCRDAIALALEGVGYDVAAVEHGRAALSYLDANAAPALILLDLMLPVMDGWEFLRARNERPQRAEIPIVLVSGEAELAKLATQHAVAGHLRKPIELEDLLATVARFVAK